MSSVWFRAAGLCALPIVLSFFAPGWGDEAKGKKYALLIGVTTYDNAAFPSLRYAENDVEKLAEILQHKSAGFDSVRVLSHTRGRKDKARKPTAANVRAELADLLADKNRRDTILIAFSGHGATMTVEDPDEKGEPRSYPFICPSDADRRGVNYATGKSKTLVNLEHLFAEFKTCGAGVQMVLMDASRREMKAFRSLDVSTVLVPRDAASLFSCGEGEKSWESAKLKHGVFFHFVLEGLRGKAKNRDNEVTWSGLSEYVRKQVPSNIGALVGEGAKQTPFEMSNVRGRSPVLARGVKDEEVVKEGDLGTPLDKDDRNSIGMEFRRIPKGKFTMGASKQVDKDASDDEEPHEVQIEKAFYLGKYEVTQKQYKEVTGRSPSWFSKSRGGAAAVKHVNTDDFPVEMVTYEDALAFMDKMNEKEKKTLGGCGYSLPTEAQWEYACRGGVATYQKYHVGDNVSKDDANVNDHLGRPCKVGSYSANKFGLHDMHGNVEEWCLDWYVGYFHKVDKDFVGWHRVVRGGCWSHLASFSRSAERSHFASATRHNNLGFRVALVPAR